MWNRIKGKPKDSDQLKSPPSSQQTASPTTSFKNPTDQNLLTSSRSRKSLSQISPGLPPTVVSDDPPTYNESVNTSPVLPVRPSTQNLAVESKPHGSRGQRPRSPNAGRRDDPLGLRVLHEPDEPRKFDIVFVHGLGGSSRLSWSKNKNLKLFWPKNWLPSEPGIGDGRVLSFGYDAGFAPSAPKSFKGISDFAKDLLFDLKYAKGASQQELDIGTKPIIFVVHSMGGLVVKEAYIQGQLDPEYKEIVHSVEGIIFLSTPHRGTGLAKVLNYLLQAAFLPRVYVADLERNSSTLQKINEQFRHAAPRLKIVSFYETRPTVVGVRSILLVERDSSVLGYPGEISKSLAADHHGMCKYESPQDPNYIHVRNCLSGLVKLIRRVGSSHSSILGIKGANTEHQQKVAQLLGISQPPEDDLNFFRSHWTPKTCEWILQDELFNKWMDLKSSENSSVLWLNGGPATGKSVLSAFIIEHLLQQKISCQYFFFRFGDQSKRTTSALLKSLALQASQMLPTFGSKLAKLADAATRLDHTDARTLWLRLFTSILLKLVGEPLFWVIDGLDEAASPRALLNMLSDISASTVPIRVFLVSRKTQELETAFERLGQKLTVDSILINHVDQDIHYFVQEEKEYFHGSPKFKDEIAKQILLKANGNFLWVHLAVKRIERCHTQKAVENALEELPSGMEELYGRMADAVARNPEESDRLLSKAALMWASFGRRPLNLNELSQAFKLDRSIPRALDLRKSIVEICGGFIVVDSNSNIAMIHQTAREFLQGVRDLPFSIKPAKAHEDLLIACLRCLMDPSFRAKLGPGPSLPPFLEYAATSWYYHLGHCIESSEATLALLIRFLRSQFVLTWIQVIGQISQLGSLVEASRILTRYASRRRNEDEDKMPPLRKITEVEVLEKWATDLVKIVGRFGLQLLAHPGSIHKLIPPFCPPLSAIYQQFGKNQNVTIQGLSRSGWDDSMARLFVGTGRQTALVLSAGIYFAVLAKSRISGGEIFIYEAKTCRELRRLNHEERVQLMALDNSGSKLATYGFRTTKIWNVSTGVLLHTLPKPSNAIPLVALFVNEDSNLLTAYNDRVVRQLSVDTIELSWGIAGKLEETEEIQGTFYNAPTSIAINPNGRDAAVAYRGFPLTIWDIDAEQPLYRCMRTSMARGDAQETWHAVRKVIWRPFTEEVIGLYDDSSIFKWDPLLDDHQVNAAGAVIDIACSQDGHYFLTGHTKGVVKIWNATHFTPIYQISSPSYLSGFAFSPDSRRVYDIRGSYCNVWEPNILVRLGEVDVEGDSSYAAAEAGSQHLSADSGFAEGTPETPPMLTSLARHPSSPAYCTGNEDGLVELINVEHGIKMNVWPPSTSDTQIEKVVWSDDGCLIVAADLHGRLCACSVVSEAGPDLRPAYNFTIILDKHLNIEGGAIRDLIISADKSRILVFTLARLSLVSLTDGSILALRLVESQAEESKWINIQSSINILVELRSDSLRIYSWHDLSSILSASYEQAWEDSLTLPISDEDVLHSGTPPPMTGEALTEQTSQWPKISKVERVHKTHDMTQVLIEVSYSLTPGSIFKKILLVLDTAAIVQLVQESNSKQPEKFQTAENDPKLWHLLPSFLSQRIERALGFLARDHLIFLDHDFWVCSTIIPNITTASSDDTSDYFSALRRKSSGAQSALEGGSMLSNATADGVTQHYCLPADWVSLDSLKLATLLADGTVLYPKNGEVVAVECRDFKNILKG